MGKIRTTYSKKIKEKAVRLYFEEGVGSTTIGRELGIPSHKIVMRWVRHFENEGLEGLEEKRGKSRGFRKGRLRKHPMSLEVSRSKESSSKKSIENSPVRVILYAP